MRYNVFLIPCAIAVGRHGFVDQHGQSYSVVEGEAVAMNVPQGSGPRRAERIHPKMSKKLRREDAVDTPAEALEKQACREDSFDGKFDLVITWWTQTAQSAVGVGSLSETASGNSSKSETASGNSFRKSSKNAISRIENQREIMYLLRGAEKYGLLDHVKQVFVVIDSAVLKAFGAPRDLDWDHPQLHLIPGEAMGVKGCGYLNKLASLHRIQGISDWFLVLQDDVFPTLQFSTHAIYDFETSRPRIRMGMDPFIQGWCDDGKPSLNHGPWFVSRCRLAELESTYQEKFLLSREGNETRDTIDAQCIYDNWASRTFASVVSSDDPLYDDYCRVCHTNGGCDLSILQNPKTMFTNVQGYGISDEYHDNIEFRNQMISWLKEAYPIPSKFEK